MADAVDLPAVQVLFQPLRRDPPTRPLLPVGGAGLVQLGGVDPLQPDVLAGDDDGVAIDYLRRASHIGERRPRGDDAEEQENSDGGMAEHQALVLCGGAGARTADTAPVEMIDEGSCAHPGLKPASIHVRGPVVAAWSKPRHRASARLSEQADQFLAIDGIHSPTIRREPGTTGVDRVAVPGAVSPRFWP